MNVSPFAILTATNVVKMTAEEMQSENFAVALYNNAYIYNLDTPTIEACGWTAVSEDFLFLISMLLLL